MAQKKEEKPLSVDEMTSRDFREDREAHIEIASNYMRDKELMDHFKKAIVHNSHLFRGRIVLDIGCGMCLLSLFAAKAGAKRVYAVDCSNVIDYAREIVHDNGYDDIIHVIKGRIQNITLPVDEVDIIVCDWVGYSLLFQSLADLVIFARDKWLKKNGIIFPDVAKLYIAGLEDGKGKNDKIDWWLNVYGFKMNRLRECALREPVIKTVLPSQLLTDEFKVMTIDLNKATANDLKFRSMYRFDIQRSGCMDGICSYFKIYFTKSHTPLCLSTDPGAVSTRWLQTVCYFDRFQPVNVGQLCYGGIQMHPSNRGNPDFDHMEIRFELYVGAQERYVDLKAEMIWKFSPCTMTTSDI